MAVTFNQLINSGQPVLIDFYDPHYRACKTLLPVIEEVKETMGNRISVININVSKNKELVHFYKISNVPTTILFQDGRQLWRKSGLLSKVEILLKILEKST